jgi:hypothetical protein
VWFWRTAQGDEVDLLIEESPERFSAVECKTAERITSADLRGIHKLGEEYGPRSVRAASVVCRTATSYPVDAEPAAQAVTLAGLLNQLSSGPGSD